MKQTRLYAVFLIYCAMCGATMAKKLPEKQMMIQLYSVRELIGSPELYAKNHVEVFRQLRRYGITMVEGSDGSGFGVSPEQFLADCQEAGLTPVSAHVGNELTDEELSTGDFSKKLEWWKAGIWSPHGHRFQQIFTTPRCGATIMTKWDGCAERQASSMVITPTRTSTARWRVRSGLTS